MDSYTNRYLCKHILLPNFNYVNHVWSIDFNILHPDAATPCDKDRLPLRPGCDIMLPARTNIKISMRIAV